MSDSNSMITPFCQYLEEDHCSDPSPLLVIIKKLKKLYHKTKADLSLNFSSYPHHVDDEYLDYFVNELYSYYQIQDADLSDAKEWLDKNNLKIDDIEKYKYPKLIKYFFELPYEPYHFKGDTTDINNIRKALILYFKDKYALEMIDFLESKKKSTQIENGTAENFTSEDVVSTIIENQIKLKKINEKIADEFQRTGNFLEEDYTEIELKYDLDKNIISNTIENLLNKLYIQSAKDNYYYFDCPVKVYISNFENRFGAYKNVNIDADIIDFINFELKNLSDTENHRVLKNKHRSFYYESYIVDEEKYIISLSKKTEFLQDKLKELGYSVDFYDDNKMNIKFQINKLPAPQNPTESSIKHTSTDNKIKWSGKKAHLGFIIGTLADNGYIDAPKKPDGEINYSEFARLLLKHFECNTTPESLAKYLNTISEKSQEVERNFSNNDFKLPHSKRVS